MDNEKDVWVEESKEGRSRSTRDARRHDADEISSENAQRHMPSRHPSQAMGMKATAFLGFVAGFMLAYQRSSRACTSLLRACILPLPTSLFLPYTRFGPANQCIV